jgi:hypothetical protein
MKKILTVLAVALLAVGSLAAQVPGAGSSRGGGSNSETKVFAIEMGTGFAYDIDAKSSSATQTVAAAFGLTDAVQAGFLVIKGDANNHSFNLVKIAVYPITDLAVNLEFGSSTAAAITSGFGLSYNVFRNSSSGLTTALQGNVGYRFSDVSKGVLALGLNLKVGL